MNVIMKRIAGLGITILIILVGLNYLMNLVERKSSDEKYSAFFEETKDFDVLYMGTSHVINGFFPMELWYDYGITSYNFGGHSNTMAVNYWVMKNALEYSNPNVMIIDCLGAIDSEKTSRISFDYVHLSMDAFPMSQVKWKAVKDLTLDNDLVKDSQKWDLLWDFSVYHDRWKDLESSDFTMVYALEKGAESRINVAVPNEIIFSANEREIDDKNIGIDYLSKMIEECQEREITVLLTYLPFPATRGNWEIANLVERIAEKYGVEYINFLNMDIVNYQTDCSDADSHLNPSGARKVTDYLGKYLQENFSLEDHRDDIEYDNWYDDYNLYKEKKKEDIANQKSLDNYLMLLQDRHFDCEVKICPQSKILKDERMINLIMNLSLQDEEEMYHKLINSDEGWLLIKKDGKLQISLCDTFPQDCAADVIIDVYDHEDGQWIDTALFNVSNSEFISAIRSGDETDN